MSCDSTLELLDDWLDGTLPPARRAEVELHLAGCPECRTIAQDAQALRPHVAALVDEAPPTDHWPAIEARIRAPRPARRWGGANTSWWAAAAVALVVASSGITAATLQRSPPTPSPPPVAVAELPELTALEAATDDLQAALALRSTELDPETRAVVERNLRIIDEAIAETRAALDGAPGDERVQHALVLAYEQKQRLLAQVLHAPAGNG
jgi:predicted anti-sigma-YlaC factor YlaD